MNCRRFQSRLPEYVEGSLSAKARAAADLHVTACSRCQAELRREKEITNAFSAGFQRRTQTLTLAPQQRRQILAATAPPAPSPRLLDAVAAWASRFALSSTVAVLLVATAFVCVRQLPEMFPRERGLTPVPGLERGPEVAIQLSTRVPIYTFRRDRQTVVDELSYETVETSEQLRLAGPGPFSQH